jgi:hypothetical protein
MDPIEQRRAETFVALDKLLGVQSCSKLEKIAALRRAPRPRHQRGEEYPRRRASDIGGRSGRFW